MLKELTEDAFLSCLAGASADELRFHFIVMSKVMEGWHTEGRVEDEHILYFVLDGCIGGEAGGEEVAAGAGEVLWTPPLLRHSYRLLEPETWTYSLRFRLEVDEVFPVVSRQTLLLTKAEELRGAFDRVYRIVQQESPHGVHRVKAALVELLALLLERLAVDEESRERRRLSPSQWKRLEAFFEQEMAYAQKPADLARVLDWHPDYFARRFREDLGISPREWLTRERLRRAALLLIETQLPIGEVAERTGYGDQRFFSRQFRRRYGCTPSEYRQVH